MTVALLYLDDHGQLQTVEKGHGGDTALGGLDMDDAFLRYATQHFGLKRLVQDPHARMRLRTELERAKIELSTAETVDVAFAWRQGPVKLKLSRRELEDAVRPTVERCRGPLRVALQEAGLAPEEIAHVLLVGGPTMMPIVRWTIQEEFQQSAKIVAELADLARHGSPVHPMEAVARGSVLGVAGKIAPHGYGFRWFQEYHELLPRRQRYPSRGSLGFWYRGTQRTFDFELIRQAVNPDDLREEYTLLGTFQFDCVAEQGIMQVDVAWEYTDNGVLHFEMRQAGGASLPLYEVSRLDGHKIARPARAAPGRVDEGSNPPVIRREPSWAYDFQRAVEAGDFHEALGVSESARKLDVDVAAARLAERNPGLARQITAVAGTLTHPERRVVYQALRRLRDRMRIELILRGGPEFLATMPDWRRELWKRCCDLARFNVDYSELVVGPKGVTSLATRAAEWVAAEVLGTHLIVVSTTGEEDADWMAVRELWTANCRHCGRTLSIPCRRIAGDRALLGDGSPEPPSGVFKPQMYQYQVARCPGCQAEGNEPATYDDTYDFGIPAERRPGVVMRGQGRCTGKVLFVLREGRPQPSEPTSMLRDFYGLQQEGTDVTLEELEQKAANATVGRRNKESETPRAKLSLSGVLFAIVGGLLLSGLYLYRMESDYRNRARSWNAPDRERPDFVIEDPKLDDFLRHIDELFVQPPQATPVAPKQDGETAPDGLGPTPSVASDNGDPPAHGIAQ